MAILVPALRSLKDVVPTKEIVDGNPEDSVFSGIEKFRLRRSYP